MLNEYIVSFLKTKLFVCLVVVLEPFFSFYSLEIIYLLKIQSFCVRSYELEDFFKYEQVSCSMTNVINSACMLL